MPREHLVQVSAKQAPGELGARAVGADRKSQRFRRAVVAPQSGRELTRIVEAVKARPGLEIGGEHYKRVPAGYDPSHPNAALPKHNGLWIGLEEKVPEAFYSAAFVDYCFDVFAPLVPLQKWLVRFRSGKI